MQTKMIYERFITAPILLIRINSAVKRARRRVCASRQVPYKRTLAILIKQNIAINITYIYHDSLAIVSEYRAS